MFIELHLLQNFAPSNLNRDDTGSPKECEFGGYRRARISSQCLKRAIREHVKDAGLLPPEDLGVRTRLIVGELAARLSEAGKDMAMATGVATAALGGINLKLDAEGHTEYLLFAGQREITALATVCLRNWDALAEVAASQQPEEGKAARSGREAKKAARAAVPQDVQRAVREALDGGKAADLAMFGRMLADLPDRNIDAACQVAHALSTHRVGIEFDFYSAVDDLQGPEATGAGMLGTVEFNSACFYRYANIDANQLVSNLQGDTALARAAVRAFLYGSIEAIPTGKQNSMAAHNPPSFALAVVRSAGLWSLANAFLKPVRPSSNPDGHGAQDLIGASIAAMDEQWGKLTGMYGTRQVRGVWYSTGEPVDLIKKLGDTGVADIDALIEGVLNAAYPEHAELPL
jgi:CRISPR system Cascade subunit CasC